jgi:transcription termination/antitermination protein NusG
MLPDEPTSADEPLPPADEPTPTPDEPLHVEDVATAEHVPADENGVAPPVAEDEAPVETQETPDTGELPGEDEAPTAEVSAEDTPGGEDEAAPAGVGEEAPLVATGNKRWYVVKVQSGREESIKEAIERRVRIEGLEEFFGQIVIPVEKVTEMRNNRKVTRTRKLYPGYLMCEVEFNDRILYLFRETSGVGDFVGGSFNRPPTPMSQREVDAMLGRAQEVTGTIVSKPKFDRGDRVRVKDGTFAGMEGEVKELVEAKNLVKVELTIFGRPVPVELEYWQVEMI